MNRITYQFCCFVRSIPQLYVVRAAVCTLLKIKRGELESQFRSPHPGSIQPDGPSAVHIVGVLRSEVWSFDFLDFSFVGNDIGFLNTVY